MVLLEDKHRPQADGAGSAASDVDTDRLGLGHELVTLGGVPGNEGTLALATEVLEMLRVLLRKALEAGIEVLASSGSVLNEVKTLNLVDDAAENKSTGRITHPGVKLAVRLVGAQSGVAEVVTSGLGLLGEGHHVRGSREVPVLVSPELSGSANTSLDLVDDHEDIVPLRDFTEATEEGRGGVVITTLRLDGLHNNSSDGVVEFLDDALDLLQAALLLLGVLLSMLLQRVLQLGESGLRPVESGNINLMDGLAARSGQTAKETSVERRLERQNRRLRRSGLLVLHSTHKFLVSELNFGASTLQLTVIHEGRLISGLIGIGTGHGGEHLVQTLGSNLEDARAQSMRPVRGREVTQSRSVDQRGGHLR